MSDDTVITGIGVVAPTGQGTDDYWKATLSGDSGIAPISRFDPAPYPVRLAGEIRGFDAEEHVSGRMMPQTDHMTRLALAAADFALADAEIDTSEIPDYDRGVATASTSGGLEFGQHELEKLWGKGWEHVSAYMSFAWYYAVNTGQISIRHGMRGPGGVLVTEQTGGLDALGYARRQIHKGTSLMVTGGVDGSLCPYGLAIQIASRRLSTEPDPEQAYRPFDAEASGYVPGEGGAILTVETRTDAEARGAPHVYGTIAGYGSAFDPDPNASGGLLRAARTALADADVTAAEIDVVFADAAGLTELDRAEADAITEIFGPRGVPVAAPKTMTGRLLSGGAALDVAAALLCLRDQCVPPAANVRPDRIDERVDLVAGEPRELAADAVLVLARGYGGFASALVLTRS